MTVTNLPTAVVVGIDGSDAALGAARWAVDEAVRRDLPLRLVHVIEPGSEAVRLENEYAEIALRKARSAVGAVDRNIRVETMIRRGGIDTALVDESRGAEMLCIGSSANRDPAMPWGGGFTTTALIRSVSCRLAVIGFRLGHGDGDSGRIGVIVDGTDTGGSVLREALTEARLRTSSRLVLEVGSRVPEDPRSNRVERSRARAVPNPDGLAADKLDGLNELAAAATSSSGS